MKLLPLSDLAIEAALAAADIIMQHMQTDINVEHKKGASSYASQVVTEVDRASEAAIISHLQLSCEQYDIALLSEETEDDHSRLEKDYFWCIDPIDGTLPFVEGRPGFCVSIALVRRDATPQIGVVYDPSTKTLYHAVSGHGAYKNRQPLILNPPNNYLTYCTDKKLKDTPRKADIEKLLHDKAKSMGLSKIRELAGTGAVLAAIRVIENGPALMIKHPKKENGGGSLWDYAAIACIYSELGLPATNYHGGPLDLNRPDDHYMNHEGVYFENLK